MQIEIQIAAPPRGNGQQAAGKFYAQSMRGSFAWGSSPATATLTYVGNAPVSAGAMVSFTIGGHFFSGICKSDTDVSASNGHLRTLEFVDLRYFLEWDWVFGAFNLPDVRLVNGRRLKRYKHMYPADYSIGRWTYTTAPLPAWQILDAFLGAPTVFTKWSVNLTSNGLFMNGLLNGAIYDVDASSGLRLDALFNLICEKTGLVFCHDPFSGGDYSTKGVPQHVGPGLLGQYRLVFTRKGYGLLPLPFPANADDRRVGVTLTENPTNVCVLGERSQYQMLEVPMIKDWSAAWEQFIEVDLLAKDLFDHEVNPMTGVRYNAYPSDPEQWQGAGDAKARALEITVREYVTLRNLRVANSGAAFADYRKFGGRLRMDMPAALYIERILFRAFKPDWAWIKNLDGQQIPLDSAPIADRLLCRTYYDPVTGAMSIDSPPEPVDGNGVLIVKGFQVGEDLFRLVQPDRMNANFFSGSNRLFGQVPMLIDDSGEGIRFVISEVPVFVSDNLLTTVDGNVVLNAAYTLQTPQVMAALVFEAERYVYWKGNGIIRTGWNAWLDPSNPLPGRNRVEPVNGLMQELVVDADGHFTEIPYADNQTADAKALVIAQSLLLSQSSYLLGGYNLKWNPKQPLNEFGTPLAPANSSCIDRIEIQTGEGGVMEVVDFTGERQRDQFVPERELDRRTLQNTLFPGQQELRQHAQDQKRFNAVLKQTPKNLFSLFQRLLRGEVDGNLFPTRFVPGSALAATLAVGTPIVRGPTAGCATAPGSVGTGDSVFVGVTVRHNEPTGGTFYVRQQGQTLARVQGPVAVNDPIGLSGNGDCLKKSGTPSVGRALEAIAGSAVTTIMVQLGAGGAAAGGGNYAGTWNKVNSYKAGQIVRVEAAEAIGGGGYATVTSTIGVFGCLVDCGPNAYTNMVPQYPEPTSGVVYWQLIALGVQVAGICQDGSGKTINFNGSSPL